MTALQAILESIHGEDQTEQYWQRIIEIVRPIVLEEAAAALDVEAKRKARSWREKVARNYWLESREWLAYAARFVRGLK